MPNMVAVQATPELVGREVTVWALSSEGKRTSGQGGIVTEVDGTKVTINAPGDRLFTWVCDTGDYECVVDEALAADKCLDFHKGDCSGEVDYRAVPNGSAVPRCVKHFDDRLNSYENSMEKYADSDCVPDWFSEADAGEHWGPEDY
jgi:hypothetical protein